MARSVSIPGLPASVALVLGSLTFLGPLTGCGGEAPLAAAPSGPTAAPDQGAAKKAPEDTSAAKAAALEALTAGEAKSGTCDDAHKAALEKLLGDIEAGMKTKNGEDGKPLGLQLVAKRVVPLGAGARSIEMAVSGRGTELHVMAYGVRDVSLDVLVGNAAATTLRSPFQRTATTAPLSLEVPKVGVVNELQSDSRQVSIKPGQPIVVKLSGQGCAGLVSFLKP